MFTYSGDPQSSPKDAVRFLIGDTDSCEPLLHDAEIEYFLRQYNNAPINAGIRCCEAIMNKFARRCDESVGSVKITFSQQYKQYQMMRAELGVRLAKEGAIPFAGGISKTQVKQACLDADRVQPDFTKGMMENNNIAPDIRDDLLGVVGD